MLFKLKRKRKSDKKYGFEPILRWVILLNVWLGLRFLGFGGEGECEGGRITANNRLYKNVESIFTIDIVMVAQAVQPPSHPLENNEFGIQTIRHRRRLMSEVLRETEGSQLSGCCASDLVCLSIHPSTLPPNMIPCLGWGGVGWPWLAKSRDNPHCLLQYLTTPFSRNRCACWIIISSLSPLQQ